MREWLEGLAPVRRTAADRRAAILAGAARSLVRNGLRRFMEPGLLALECPGEAVPGRSRLWRMGVLVKDAKAELARAWPFRPGELGAWTPGFAEGLSLSGAMFRRGRGRGGWVVRTGTRPWLGRDLGRLPCSGRLRSPRTLRGREVRGLYDCWLGACPPADPLGADVLAGLLAGALRAWRGGREWLSLPPGAAGLLGAWKVPWSADSGQTARRLLVSPFWGALAWRLMPEACGEAARSSGRPGGCPELPLACWRAFAGGRWCLETVCRRGLPYCCGRRAAARYWGGVRAAGRAAFGRWGMTSVRPEVRAWMLDWAGASCRACPRAKPGVFPSEGLDKASGA